MNHRNPADCLHRLEQLHPTDVDANHAILLDMLSDLAQSPPPPNQHLEVLEACREQLALAQAETARRYASQPVGPDSDDNAMLMKVIGLWRLMSHSYAQITRRDAAAGTLDDRKALISQRRVFYAGQVILEHYRAHRAVPPQSWAELHESFQMAERQGVEHVRVADALNETWHAQSATEAFIAVLLVDLANPFGRSVREFGWICRWAQRFAPYCDLSADKEGRKPAAYGLNLGLDHGLRPISTLGDSDVLRYFDGSKLAGQIQAVIGQFKQGVKPAALGLGEDCPTNASARLLLSLYRPWGLGSAGRRFPRHASHGQIELSGDWLAIGFHVAGKSFEQPLTPGTSRSVRSDITLLTFGERAQEVSPQDSPKQRQREAERLGFVCARWSLLDQSVGGFRLETLPSKGERIEYHQLVGVRPPDSPHFLIGRVNWLMYQDSGLMEIGVQLLNGKPQVVAARQAGLNAGVRAAYQQAFWLPEIASLQVPASVVLPGAWYQPHRVIELFEGGKTRQLRLTKLLLRGTNFDQVACEPVGEPAQHAPVSADAA